MQEMEEPWVQSLGQEDTLEGEMATHPTAPPGKPSKYRYHFCKQIIQIVFNEIYLSYFKSKRIFTDNTPIFLCGNTPDKHEHFSLKTWPFF